MSQTTEATPDPILSARKAVLLPCPCCHEPGASIAVRLNMFDTPEQAFKCLDCNTDFGEQEIREMLARGRRWLIVLSWIDGVPQFQDEE